MIALAREQLFRARWTEAINSEWTRNLKLRYPDLDGATVDRMPAQINRAIPDCLISNYESLIAGLTLPDAHDRHVLGAAIKGRVDVIVTWNLKHFPENELEKYGLEAQTPDDFLCYLLDLHPQEVCLTFQKARLRLKKPPKTAWEYLSHLNERVGLTTLFELLLPNIESL